MSEKLLGDKVKSTLKVRTYSADRENGSFLTTVKSIFKELPQAHSLGLRFAERSIRTRYRQSLFGLFWAFLPPLATALVWIILNKGHVLNFSDVGAPYPVFVITGIMTWATFVNAVTMPLQVFQANRNVLVKINFPRESIIFNAFYEIVFNAIVSSIIIVVCLLIFKVDISAGTLMFIPDLLIIIFLGMAIGLLLLPFSLLYRDIQFLLPTVLQFAMYLTPVVYAKQPFSGIAKLLDLNPLSPLITHARASLLHIPVSVPSAQLGELAATAFILLIAGVLFQHRTMKILIERMGS